MTDSNAALLLAFASIVVAFLVHWDARRRDDALEKRALKREDDSRSLKASETAISSVVDRYHMIVHQSGAGANWLTLRQAGIATLRSDAEVREAISRIALAGPHPLADFKSRLDTPELDLRAVFVHSAENDFSFAASLEALSRPGSRPAG